MAMLFTRERTQEKTVLNTGSTTNAGRDEFELPLQRAVGHLSGAQVKGLRGPQKLEKRVNKSWPVDWQPVAQIKYYWNTGPFM